MEDEDWEREAGLFCNVAPGTMHANGTTSCADDWNEAHPENPITMPEWQAFQDMVERDFADPRNAANVIYRPKKES